ncbi:hypothetical protein D3C73_1554010 [compost metagenome]
MTGMQGICARGIHEHNAACGQGTVIIKVNPLYKTSPGLLGDQSTVFLQINSPHRSQQSLRF